MHRANGNDRAASVCLSSKEGVEIRRQLLDLIEEKAKSLPHDDLVLFLIGLLSVYPTSDLWRAYAYVQQRPFPAYCEPCPKPAQSSHDRVYLPRFSHPRQSQP